MSTRYCHRHCCRRVIDAVGGVHSEAALVQSCLAHNLRCISRTSAGGNVSTGGRSNETPVAGIFSASSALTDTAAGSFASGLAAGRPPPPRPLAAGAGLDDDDDDAAFLPLASTLDARHCWMRVETKQDPKKSQCRRDTRHIENTTHHKGGDAFGITVGTHTHTICCTAQLMVCSLHNRTLHINQD
jgi:hypothetical protein